VLVERPGGACNSPESIGAEPVRGDPALRTDVRRYASKVASVLAARRAHRTLEKRSSGRISRALVRSCALATECKFVAAGC
jgi:hypothetical protein